MPTPERPDQTPAAELPFHENRARELLATVREGDPATARRFINYHPKCNGLAEREVRFGDWTLNDARLVVAREERFDSWRELDAFVERLSAMDADPTAARFERAADFVVHGDVEGLRKLLAEDPGLVQRHSPREHGAILLHYSATNGVEDRRQRVPGNAVEIARLLVGAGADINAPAGFYGGGGGSTPLVGLVTSGHPNEAGLMEELIRAYASTGQSLDGLDDDGLPMVMSLLFRHPHAARTLAECGARIDNVATAAGLGRLELVRAGVRRGSPPTADPGGLKSFAGVTRTPSEAVVQALHFAAVAGEVDVVRFLLDAGVDPNGPLAHGMTALHEAAYAGHEAVVQALVQAGAAADRRERQFGATPVGWAGHGGHLAVVRYLLDHTQVDFMDLVEMGDVAGVRDRLRRVPTLVDGADGTGSPLRTAAAGGDLAMLRLLLDSGADPRLRGKAGKTALDTARDFGRPEATELLVKG